MAFRDFVKNAALGVLLKQPGEEDGGDEEARKLGALGGKTGGSDSETLETLGGQAGGSYSEALGPDSTPQYPASWPPGTPVENAVTPVISSAPAGCSPLHCLPILTMTSSTPIFHLGTNSPSSLPSPSNSLLASLLSTPLPNDCELPKSSLLPTVLASRISSASSTLSSATSQVSTHSTPSSPISTTPIISSINSSKTSHLIPVSRTPSAPPPPYTSIPPPYSTQQLSTNTNKCLSITVTSSASTATLQSNISSWSAPTQLLKAGSNPPSTASILPHTTGFSLPALVKGLPHSYASSLTAQAPVLPHTAVSSLTAPVLPHTAVSSLKAQEKGLPHSAVPSLPVPVLPQSVVSSHSLPTQAVLPQLRVAPCTPPILSPAHTTHVAPVAPLAPNYRPRKEKTRLLGIFAVRLTTMNLEKVEYVAVVLDKGTLMVPGAEASNLLSARLELGRKCDLTLMKQDPTRVSFDRVELDLGFRKYSVEKPGSAAKVVNCLHEKPVFYLQATAVVRVDSFLARERGLRWVHSADLLSAGTWQAEVGMKVTNTDLRCFLQRCNSNPATASPSTTVSLSSTLSSSLLSPSPSFPSPSPSLSSPIPTISSPSRSHPVSLPSSLLSHLPTTSHSSVTPSPSLLKVAAPSVPDVRYPALSVAQAINCTLCINCKRKFKYAIEFLFHFTFKKACLRVVLKGKCHKSLFYEKLSQNIQSKVQVKESSLCCLKSVGQQAERRVCGFKSLTVLQYCMHGDKHVPDSGEMFACCICTGLFFTPFSAYRHRCFVQLQMEAARHVRPNSLHSVYSALAKETLNVILTCASCGKRYDYVSGLLNHLKKSNSRCLAQLSENYTRFLTSERYLHLGRLLQEKTGLVMSPTQCEVCEEVLISELAYCMHKDHHSVAGDAKFVCKGCQADCTSPCAFYRHVCSSPETAWCPLCDKAGAHKVPDHKIEEIVIDDDDTEETSSDFSVPSGIGIVIPREQIEEQISLLDFMENHIRSGGTDSEDISELEIVEVRGSATEFHDSGIKSITDHPEVLSVVSESVIVNTKRSAARVAFSDMSVPKQRKILPLPSVCPPPPCNSPSSNLPSRNSPSRNSPSRNSPPSNSPTTYSPTTYSPPLNSPSGNSPSKNSPSSNSPSRNSTSGIEANESAMKIAALTKKFKCTKCNVFKGLRDSSQARHEATCTGRVYWVCMTLVPSATEAMHQPCNRDFSSRSNVLKHSVSAHGDRSGQNFKKTSWKPKKKKETSERILEKKKRMFMSGALKRKRRLERETEKLRSESRSLGEVLGILVEQEVKMETAITALQDVKMEASKIALDDVKMETAKTAPGKTGTPPTPSKLTREQIEEIFVDEEDVSDSESGPAVVKEELVDLEEDSKVNTILRQSIHIDEFSAGGTELMKLEDIKVEEKDDTKDDIQTDEKVERSSNYNGPINDKRVLIFTEAIKEMFDMKSPSVNIKKEVVNYEDTVKDAPTTKIPSNKDIENDASSKEMGKSKVIKNETLSKDAILFASVESGNDSKFLEMEGREVDEKVKAVKMVKAKKAGLMTLGSEPASKPAAGPPRTLRSKILKVKESLPAVRPDGSESGGGAGSPESVKGEEEQEEEDSRYWAQYCCMTCSSLLDGASGLWEHRKEQGEHDIRPLWSFNQNDVKLVDLRKSREFGVMVREVAILWREKMLGKVTKDGREIRGCKETKEIKEAKETKEAKEAKEIKENKETMLIQWSKEREADRISVDSSGKEAEDTDIKLRIGKRGDGHFSVIP